MFAWPASILAQASAAADDLPVLGLGVHRFEEHQVHNIGHVDAGVEHVDRDWSISIG